MLATGLGSNPSVATLMSFFISSIISGVIYDLFVDFLQFLERNEFMKNVLLIGLGCCGDIVLNGSIC